MAAGVRCVGRSRKTWGECVKDDTKLLECSLNGQHSGIFGETSYIGQTSNPSLAWNI